MSWLESIVQDDRPRKNRALAGNAKADEAVSELSPGGWCHRRFRQCPVLQVCIQDSKRLWLG